MFTEVVPKGPINNIPALVQIMAWHRPGDKPLSEPMMVSVLTHICVTRPQWVKTDNKASRIACWIQVLDVVHLGYIFTSFFRWLMNFDYTWSEYLSSYAANKCFEFEYVMLTCHRTNVDKRASVTPKVFAHVFYSSLGTSGDAILKTNNTRWCRGNAFRITAPLWEESICHQWIPLIKARNVMFWCPLCY